MMEMKEQTGSRKKLLVPVVVLMLCLVTLTGAAYAYSSSVTISENQFASDSLSIDLSTGAISGGRIDETATTSKAVTFTDDFVYSTVAPLKTTAVVCTVADKKIFTYHLTISGDATCNVLKVSSSNIETLLTKAIGNTTVDGLLDIQVKVGEETKTLTTNNTALEFTVSKTTASPVNVDVEIYVKSTAVSPATEASTIVQTAADSSQDSTHNAAWFTSQFNPAAKIALKFEAVGPVTA